MKISFEEATSRCWAEVDLGRLVLNYKNALNHLKGNTRLICVLKADAYGHGAVQVAKVLEELGAAYLAVSDINEARELFNYLPVEGGDVRTIRGEYKDSNDIGGNDNDENK